MQVATTFKFLIYPPLMYYILLFIVKGPLMLYMEDYSCVAVLRKEVTNTNDVYQFIKDATIRYGWKKLKCNFLCERNGSGLLLYLESGIQDNSRKIDGMKWASPVKVVPKVINLSVSGVNPDISLNIEMRQPQLRASIRSRQLSMIRSFV